MGLSILLVVPLQSPRHIPYSHQTSGRVAGAWLVLEDMAALLASKEQYKSNALD